MTQASVPPRASLLRKSAWQLGLCALATLLCAAPALPAQIPLQPDETAPAKDVALPAFDVVSIKENRTGPGIMRLMMKPDAYEAVNLPFKDIVAQAYGIRQDLIFGLPEWASSLRFDLNAKVDAADVPTWAKLSPSQRAAMLVPVLMDRCGLQVHKEMRTLPTYDLIEDKGGTRLKLSTALPPDPSRDPNAAPDMKRAGMFSIRPGRITATAFSMVRLSSELSYILHRPVEDKTGLTGRYDMNLTWTPEEAPGSGADSGSDEQAGSIFTALREQLGLKLVSSKASVETLVVDHVEKPSPN